MTIVLIIIGIAVVVGIIISMVVVIIHVNLKRKMLDMKKTTDNFKELPKKDPPKPLPPEKPLNIPKPTDPDYVDIPLVEHGDLESLIKKGPDDAFNTKTEDYQVDPSLEALIKKGADDPFKTNADDYQIDPSLAALIKSGEEGLGNKISLEKDNTPKDDDLQ